MTAKSYAKLVRVKVEKDGSAYFATSTDLKGLMVVSHDPEDLEKMIPIYIADMYKAAGVTVIVKKLEDQRADGAEPWVALPLDEGICKERKLCERRKAAIEKIAEEARRLDLD